MICDSDMRMTLTRVSSNPGSSSTSDWNDRINSPDPTSSTSAKATSASTRNRHTPLLASSALPRLPERRVFAEHPKIRATAKKALELWKRAFSRTVGAD